MKKWSRRFENEMIRLEPGDEALGVILGRDAAEANEGVHLVQVAADGLALRSRRRCTERIARHPEQMRLAVQQAPDRVKARQRHARGRGGRLTSSIRLMRACAARESDIGAIARQVSALKRLG